MYLKQLELVNFRNYNNTIIELKNNINIFVGDNAQGKTNLLEAIYFLCSGKSTRTSNIDNLIKFGKATANVSGVLQNEKNIYNLFIGFDKEKKILKINNKIINKNKDYLSTFNIITFFPDDLDIIKGMPEIRRKYINNEICQISSSYSQILDEYQKLLKMRNDYLNCESNFNISYFDVLTSYLIERFIIICKYRKNYINKINNYISKVFFNITNMENFYLEYQPNIDIDYNSIDSKKIIYDEYQKIYKDEIKNRKTLIGPHRDDFKFILNGKELKLYGSQGQQRVSIIALKLSEILLIEEIKNSTPIILLDDVFSELDDDKINNLLKYINKTTQIIITTTDLTNIDNSIIKNANIIKIKNGNLEKVK